MGACNFRLLVPFYRRSYSARPSRQAHGTPTQIHKQDMLRRFWPHWDPMLLFEPHRLNSGSRGVNGSLGVTEFMHQRADTAFREEAY